MTEIRIYPKDNLAVIRKEVTDEYDILEETAEIALDGWRDDEWIYYKLPLDDLMTAVKHMASGDLSSSQ